MTQLKTPKSILRNNNKESGGSSARPNTFKEAVEQH